MNTEESVRARIDTSTEHHLWTGYVQKPKGKDKGYGRIFFQGTRKYVHVLIWEWEHGPMVPGWTIDHLCGVTLCQRLDHLEAVPPGENRRRERDRATLCGNKLHPFPDERFIVKSTGETRCRQCAKAADARHRAKRMRVA